MHSSSNITIILLILDDLILDGINNTKLAHVKAFLDDKFKIKDLGELKFFFLGCQICLHSHGLQMQHLNPFIDTPTSIHFQVAHIVLRYIKNTLEFGIFLPAASTLQFKRFSDSIWPGCVDSQKSITRFCIFLGSSLISGISRSSSRVEYRALTSTTYEL
ncbi:hypothetical protein MANES_16G065025v8 [Manihot esculenta]|uniref:Uncharacterized protein n=1 Tax=Manihot esculenta TaxID=3983 RepID=A0ACB7GAN6_MANES|nr:hypothetical protein MANES_16G065025v8 [Manihot esculenta]